jgi:hypothetical protein
VKTDLKIHEEGHRTRKGVTLALPDVSMGVPWKKKSPFSREEGSQEICTQTFIKAV